MGNFFSSFPYDALIDNENNHLVQTQDSAYVNLI